MADKMKQSIGYHLMLSLTKLLTLTAILTLIPLSSVTKECALGYKAVCSFAPYSTLILLAIAGISCKIRSKFLKKR